MCLTVVLVKNQKGNWAMQRTQSPVRTSLETHADWSVFGVNGPEFLLLSQQMTMSSRNPNP